MKAVVFDLYSTLIYLQEKIFHLNLFRELQLDKKQIREVKRTVLTKDFNSISEYISSIASGKTINSSSYEKQLESEIESAWIYPETIEVLKNLKRIGLLTGVISNLSSPYKKAFFNLGLDKLVDSYIFSCDVGVKKPDKKIYLSLLSALNLCPEDALMVGDSLLCDVKGPSDIGMISILLDRKGVSGYEKRISSLKDIFTYL